MSVHHPDKVRGLQFAVASNSRAIREGRFDDALRHALAMEYLVTDLRTERRQR